MATLATLAPIPIASLWASWTDLNELVDVEKYGLPHTTPWTKAAVKSQFQTKDLAPISCPHLPAPCIPSAVMPINASRNNMPALENYIAHNPFWLAHRILFQAHFISAVRFTTDECYFLIEEGDVTLQVNGRPLTEEERGVLDTQPGKLDMGHLQPANIKMKKGVAMRIMPYTVYCFRVAVDSLVTTGNVVPRGLEVEGGLVGRDYDVDGRGLDFE